MTSNISQNKNVKGRLHMRANGGIRKSDINQNSMVMPILLLMKKISFITILVGFSFLLNY